MKSRFVVINQCLQIRDGVLFPIKPKEAMTMAIEKWKTIVNELKKGIIITRGDGAFTCALCHLYIENDCSDCPVKNYTGQPYCYNTPCSTYSYNLNVTIKIAKDEVIFLKKVQATLK
jgi:hypothetical protein